MKVIIKRVYLEKKLTNKPTNQEPRTKHQTQKNHNKMPEHSEEIKKFIREHSSLFWYIKEDAKERISLDSLVEHILNYGNIEDVKTLIELLGIKKVSKIFFKQINRKRCNYFPKVKNYFTLYFNRHA